MKMKLLIAILYLFFCIYGELNAQLFLPKISTQNVIQKDTSNVYFKEIWINSKDVNTDDAFGFMRRASDKIQLGFIKEALDDIEKSISLDSLLSYNYTLKGYCKLKQDSAAIALKYFNTAKAINDTDAINYYYIGEVYSSWLRFQEADSFYYISTVIDRKFYNAYFARANIAFANEKFSDAEKLYKKVIDLNPDFAEAYFNLAILYLYYDSDKTLRYLNKTLNINPKFAYAYFFRGYLRLFNYTTAGPTLNDWDKAIALDSTNMMYRKLKGMLLIFDYKHKQGIDELLKVIELSEDNNYTSDFEKSESEQHLSDFFAQLLTFKQYLDLLQDEEKDLLKKALAHFYKKEHEKARDLYDKLLIKSNYKGLVYYLMGFNMEYLRNYKSTQEYYRMAMQEINFPYETHLRMGSVLMELNKYQEAIISLNKYILRFDSIKFAYRCRGISYIKTGQIDSALLDFDRFLTIDSTDEDIYYNRAICLKAKGNLSEAIDNFNKVQKYSMKFDMESAVHMADCMYMSGDTLKALRFLCNTYDSAKWLTDEGFYLRGILYLNYSKLDSAILDFTQFLKFNSKNTSALFYRGKAYYSKNDFDKAITDFNAVLAIDNNDINALYFRAIIYIKTKRPDLALIDLELADKLGHPKAKEVIENYLK